MNGLKRTYQIFRVAALVLSSAGSIDSSTPQTKVNVQHTTERGVSLTTIKLDPIIIQSDEVTKAYILISASVVYEDRLPKRKTISLYFHSRAPDCRFSNKSNLVLKFDGKTIRLTSHAKKNGDGGLWVFSELEGDLCNESCSVLISEQTFLRITKSNNVEARIGAVTLQLGEIHKRALRELAGYLVTG
jgi:hypothetical protein